MEKEKSDNTGMAQGNLETKPAWNKSSSNGDYGIKPVMGASLWPALSETTTTTRDLSNKSSSDSLKNLGDGSSSSSVSLSQDAGFVAELNYIQLQQRYMKQSSASTSTNGCVAAQHSRQSSSSFPENSLHYHFPRDQNQRNEFASQSHHGNSYKNPNGNHQIYRGMRNQEHENQNWNLHKHFNERGRFLQPPKGTPGFVRPAQPYMPTPIHTQFMLPHPIYPFGVPIVFPEFAPPPQMYYPHRMPFVEPPPFYDQSQELPLNTKIQSQVHYYFSEENLLTDEFLRKPMNDEGFVHIQSIAGFRKLKALTNDIQLILYSLQSSNVVELHGYEIRSRHMWKRFLMLVQLRIRFIPSPQNEMASKFEDEMGSSSSSKKGDKKKNNSTESKLPLNPR